MKAPPSAPIAVESVREEILYSSVDSLIAFPRQIFQQIYITSPFNQKYFFYVQHG